MGQTTTIFPHLKRAYRAVVHTPTIDRAVHNILNNLVNGVAALQGFAFPPKFNWDWKWEMLSGAYERETTELFKKIITPGMKVVDVGAHVGYFTRLFAKLVGPTGIVYAFEANPQNFALLKYNCLKLLNTRLFAEAVADREGTVDFFATENNSGCHSLIQSTSRPNKYSVKATSLDTLKIQQILNDVQLIKIDIEGAEPQAIRGMNNVIQSNPNIALMVELCPENLLEAGSSPEALILQIQEFGLRTFAITESGLKEITADEARQKVFHIKENYHYVNVYASRNPQSF